MDESGISLSLVRRCARSMRGKRAYAQRPERKGKNVSVIGAISLSGLLAFWCSLESLDALTFDAFIAQKLVPLLWPGSVVILDNCSIHKSQELEALISAAGARLIYLPPYSPDFSPIENCWSKIKTILKTIGARTYPLLQYALELAFAAINPTDWINWFAHCCYCASVD